MSGTQVAEFQKLADSLKERRLFQEGLDVCEKVLGYGNVASKSVLAKSLLQPKSDRCRYLKLALKNPWSPQDF